MTIITSLRDPRLPLRNTAVALGLFDGVHLGHRAVLQAVVDEAARSGLAPCVFTFALAETPAHIKAGAAQLTTPHRMAELLAELGMLYAIAPSFGEMKELDGQRFVKDFLLDTLGARFVSCGSNFAFGRGRSSTAGDLRRMTEELGMVCQVAATVEDGGEPVSSTRIRECITAGDIPQANRLLGRPFVIDFTVVEGNRIGRTLGSPTINQPFPQGFVIPRFGVYATAVCVDGEWHSGVTNVGIKPTVGSDGPLAETYIHNFSGDLYGRQVEVAFVEFIRTERKFGSLEELRANILRDAETARLMAAPHLERLKKQGE